MAHRGSFRRSGISQSQRRKKTWGAFGAVATNSAGSSPSGVISANLNFDVSVGSVLPSPQEHAFAYAFDADDIEGIKAESTLLRIRGSLQMLKNTANGVLETQAFGIAVVESTNLSGASPKFPNPANPIGAQWDGWMFYRSINSAIVDANATNIDVKSMRKIQSGYSLIFIAGSHVASTDDASVSAPPISTQLIARGLFLLP